jgi:hypothetical protein
MGSFSENSGVLPKMAGPSSIGSLSGQHDHASVDHGERYSGK